jgi:hypothetical protein
MRLCVHLVGLAAALLLGSCTLDREGTGVESTQAAGDASQGDTGADGATPDALPDAGAADSPVDASEADSEPDVPPDVPPDVALTDAVDDGPADAVDEPEASVVVFCDASDPYLAACYRFDDAGNLGLDESQYGNHALASGVSAVAGVSGTALAHGATSVVKVADSASLDVAALTIEAWIQPSALPANRAGLFDNDGQYGFFLQSTGQVRCSAAAIPLTSTPTVAVGTWTHVAFTYDGATLAIYINGQQTDAIPATATMTTSSTTGSCIGANSPSGDAFLGAIDQLRVWRRARTAQEICAAAGACP